MPVSEEEMERFDGQLGVNDVERFRVAGQLGAESACCEDAQVFAQALLEALNQAIDHGSVTLEHAGAYAIVSRLP